MSFGPEEYPQEYGSQDPPNATRVVLPGVFLIIVAVLNLVLAGVAGIVAAGFQSMPDAEMQHVYDTFIARLAPEQRAATKQYGVDTPEGLRSAYVNWAFSCACAGRAVWPWPGR
jgi:hypothetical protein